MFFVVKRATLLVPSGKGKHLNVILTDPQGKDKEVLLVPFCSAWANNNHDYSCLIGKGDHKFLQHDSYVAYAFLSIERASAIAEAVRRKTFEAHDICSTELHALICGGLLKSPFAAPIFKEFYRNSLAVSEPETGPRSRISSGKPVPKK